MQFRLLSLFESDQPLTNEQLVDLFTAIVLVCDERGVDIGAQGFEIVPEAPEPTSNWTVELQEQALAEGWGVFYNDMLHGLEIQRVDEVERFPNDEHALAYVHLHADQGSTLHQAALQAIGWMP